jgi:hypothetical protein
MNHGDLGRAAVARGFLFCSVAAVALAMPSMAWAQDDADAQA